MMRLAEPTDSATSQMFCRSSRKAGDAKAGDAKAGDAKAGDAKAECTACTIGSAESTSGTIGLVDCVGEFVVFGATRAAAICGCGENELSYSKHLANELSLGFVLCGDNAPAFRAAHKAPALNAALCRVRPASAAPDIGSPNEVSGIAQLV